MTAWMSGAKLTLYASSKGGVLQLTRSLACAWAPDNIQVNAILPGFFNTELTRKARKDIPDLEQRVINRTPIGRWGETEELAGTAIFLATHASDFVTGAALPVDGGFSIMI
jgi:2-deoxy-D-gluconate 3-dehydrogenase